MPKYKVKDTHIRHGAGKEAKVYGPGEEMELTEEQAAKLSVEPATEGSAKKDGEKITTRELSADEAIKRIGEAATTEDLKAISIKGDDRVTVNEAYKARQAELKK
jgi:hypothetical protein